MLLKSSKEIFNFRHTDFTIYYFERILCEKLNSNKTRTFTLSLGEIIKSIMKIPIHTNILCHITCIFVYNLYIKAKKKQLTDS